ncbi:MULTISPECIES: serine/threonine-protein kinase [Sorangium]|uniref:Protein kinase n=1 Tax=Sorangium cellulosum TaxID=56 RepID=A0A4P2QWI0_SORCE|nr:MULTISPECIES: serine/threonine-protein kinase [Sorangium]AUX34765.1 protein kinase [Sorangium cellulosum]WCQ94076.1 serine-threonine kinase [Sorangium sp. Soce836]
MHRCAVCHGRLADGAPCARDGFTPPPGEHHPVAGAAPAVGGFSVLGPLGRGGFSDVWAAERDDDGAPAAIKVARQAAASLRERFRREAALLERVGVPHVAQLYAQGELADGRPYLAMERLFGRTLADELAALRAPLDPDRAAGRADAILAVLEAAHARGVVHRDLKPENLFLLRSSGRAVLLDLGLAKLAQGDDQPASSVRATRAGDVVGTPEYMAPEQLRGDAARIDARADIYAFGVILFELLTLRPPFVGNEDAVEHGHLALRPPRPSDLADVPEGLEELTLACLAKDPSRRPDSAAALRRTLHALRARPAGDTLPPPPSSRRSGPRSSPPGDGVATAAAEGRQPVALLLAEAGAGPVIAAVGSRRGFVARQRGQRCLAVFSARDVHDPARAALAAAREIAERSGARVALHLASVRLRRVSGGMHAAYGSPVERPETWLPPEPWRGLAMTEEFQRALPEEELAPTPPDDPESLGEPPLLGRDDVLSALAGSATEAFDGACPGLFTLIGDAGLGKTRLTAEAACIAGVPVPDVRVVVVRALHPIHGGAAQAVRALLRVALDAPDGTPDDPRGFCVARLGEALGGATWEAVAAALGWADPGGGRLSGAARHGLMLALAEALRQRARRGPLAVILDDADQADDVLLDALEYATLDGEGVLLWAVVTARPRFEQARPSWGQRNQRHTRVTLAPLAEEAAMDLASRLLLPAEFPPAETLRRLADWAGGNPDCLRQIVRSLKHAGVVRRRAGGGFYLATAEVEALPPAPAWQWLAARQLDELPAELAACARVCSALGMSFDRAELEAVLDGLERAGGAGPMVDAGFGLSALVERRILQRDSEGGGGADDRHAFQNAIFQEAVYEMLDPAHRAEIHLSALAYWRAQVAAGSTDGLRALARHAAASGECAEAADAYLALGDLASARHHVVEADQRYGAALQVAGPGDARRRVRALAGRGRSRYRMCRLKEARRDFGEALALAEALGDAHQRASLLLEDATALDWDFDFEASARRVDEARPLVDAARSPELALLLRVAEGRTSWRRGKLEASIAELTDCAEQAGASGDYDARVLALLMLSFQLASAGRREEAERAFGDLIALLTAAGDRFHLCAAYINRIALWAWRWSLPGAVDDLRRAVDLAREIGNPWLEKMASYNVAVLLHWSDRQREALALARRARWLEEQASERPVPHTAILLAQIHLVLDEYEQASQLALWIARSCVLEPGDVRDYALLELVLSEVGLRPAGSSSLSWDEAIALARDQPIVENTLQLFYWRARMALRRGHTGEAEESLASARALRAASPMWLSRFGELERRLEEASRTDVRPTLPA